MKRRMTALLCGIAVLLSVAVWSAQADERVFFTAVNENVLPLSDDTMPFWSDGYLYVAASTFTGTVRSILDVAYVRTSQNLPIIYGGRRSLQFDLQGSIVLDEEGQNYYPSAIEKKGTVFVPIALICYFFGMTYSRLKVPHGWMVRIKNDRAGLDDASFVDAATYTMDLRYQDYLRAKEPQQDTSDTPSVEQPPSIDPTEPQPSDEGGKQIYLCAAADDGTAVKGLLGELNRSKLRAAFYCTEAFLMEQGDLLREMSVTGQTIGLLVDGSDPNRSVQEQIQAENDLLYQATCGMTRLVYIQNGTRADARTAKSKGYFCLTPTVNNSRYLLKSTSEAGELLERISAKRTSSVKVWLGDGADAVGLRAFLSAAHTAGDPCLALNETTR